MSSDMKEIKALTSLRGIFAIWVVFFHLRAFSDWQATSIPIIDHGYLAVDFFFMLSGFILAGAHGAAFGQRFDLLIYGRFIFLRIARLFPLHSVVLALSLLIIYINHEPQYWRTYIANEAALIHRWGFIYAPRGALNGPDWSISTEWAANLLFPVFVVITGLASKTIWRPAFASITAAATLIWLALRHGNLDIGEANSYLPIARCFAEFALGLILYRCRLMFRRASSDAILMILTIIIILALISKWDLLVITAMIPLLPGLAQSSGFLSMALSRQTPYEIGKISYSIYLIQLPVIRSVDIVFAGSSLAGYAHWILPPILIPIAAILSYRLVEKPCNLRAKQLNTAFGRHRSAVILPKPR